MLQLEQRESYEKKLKPHKILSTFLNFCAHPAFPDKKPKQNDDLNDIVADGNATQSFEFFPWHKEIRIVSSPLEEPIEQSTDKEKITYTHSLIRKTSEDSKAWSWTEHVNVLYTPGPYWTIKNSLILMPESQRLHIVNKKLVPDNEKTRAWLQEFHQLSQRLIAQTRWHVSSWAWWNELEKR